MNVKWGEYSQIACELALLRNAMQNDHYQYYHLISGADLPLKSKENIFDFFDECDGEEFVQFSSLNPTEVIRKRISLYHLVGKRKNWLEQFGGRCMTLIERVLKTDRTKRMREQLAYGANWFSITDNLARYVLKKEPFIKKYFSFGSCADELFLQTIVYNSSFFVRTSYCRDDLPAECGGNMRKVDFSRSTDGNSPHVWRMTDYDELMSSPCLFARKFDLSIDPKIVDALYQTIVKEGN